MCAETRENLSSGVANNTGADQPAHPRRLISAFVISFLESIIRKLGTGELFILQLHVVSVAEQAGLNLTLSETPKTGFLATKTRHVMILHVTTCTCHQNRDRNIWNSYSLHYAKEKFGKVLQWCFTALCPSERDTNPCLVPSQHKGCFTYTPNPNRNRTETITAAKLHRFLFGRHFTYEPNPWTKSKKMPV